MKRVKYIFRIVYFIVAVLVLVFLNREPDDNQQSIVEFKFKMLQKVQTDTLDAKQKVDLLVNETTKFVDDFSHVKQGINYLMQLLSLVIVTELVFLILKNKNSS